MADTQTAITTQFTQEHLEHLKTILQGLKDDAKQANDQGDVFMLDVYNELIKVVSDVVVRATARLERQERANINKAHKALRKQRRALLEQQKAAAQQGSTPASA